jgi:hypothetical protein
MSVVPSFTSVVRCCHTNNTIPRVVSKSAGCGATRNQRVDIVNLLNASDRTGSRSQGSCLGPRKQRSARCDRWFNGPIWCCPLTRRNDTGNKILLIADPPVARTGPSLMLTLLRILRRLPYALARTKLAMTRSESCLAQIPPARRVWVAASRLASCGRCLHRGDRERTANRAVRPDRHPHPKGSTPNDSGPGGSGNIVRIHLDVAYPFAPFLN